MTDQSDEMLVLLQELAILKEEDEKRAAGGSARRKRLKEITKQMKKLALEKKRSKLEST